jgi:long-chain acyl-CoA synthetase
MIGAAAARHGDRTALICRDRTLTYAELDDAIDRVAAGLSLHGVRPGARVTLFSENRWEWVAASLEEVTADAPEGEDGELMVRGPLVTLGYYGNETATRETIEPDGWMHTGDIARRRGSHFFIVDRLKDMILSGGYNVYPAEIERALAGHPDVALVGVGRVPDPTLGEVAHAYIVPVQDHAPDPDAILAFARAQLAPYKIPKAVHVVAALPATASGKIRRRDLTPPPGTVGTPRT